MSEKQKQSSARDISQAPPNSSPSGEPKADIEAALRVLRRSGGQPPDDDDRMP